MRKAQLWTKQSSPRTAPSLFWSPATKSPTSSPTCSPTKSSRRAVARSLQHSASFPVYTSSSTGRQSDWESWPPLVSGHHRRPLPALPQHQPGRQRLSLQAELGKHRETGGKREVQRRQTFHYCPSNSNKDDREDHIYEEIEDEDDSEDDGDDHSFLSLISSERRRNLRLYGLTDWDYGNQRS